MKAIVGQIRDWITRPAEAVTPTVAIWMKRAHLFLTFFWLAMSVPTQLWWKDSVEWVSWMSLYAIVATHWSAYQASRAEVNSTETNGVELPDLETIIAALWIAEDESSSGEQSKEFERIRMLLQARA